MRRGALQVPLCPVLCILCRGTQLQESPRMNLVTVAESLAKGHFDDQGTCSARESTSSTTSTSHRKARAWPLAADKHHQRFVSSHPRPSYYASRLTKTYCTCAADLWARAALAAQHQTITNLSQPMPAASRAPPRFCASPLPAAWLGGGLTRRGCVGNHNFQFPRARATEASQSPTSD